MKTIIPLAIAALLAALLFAALFYSDSQASEVSSPVAVSDI